MTSTLHIHEIKAADRDTLTRTWKALFHAPPPPKISSALIQQILAFEIQAKSFGRLDAKTKRHLAKLQDASKSSHRTGQRPKSNSAAKLKPGAHILREWNGITHRVDVTTDGFLWNAQRFKSLSAIAMAITGTRWSGPRFFGLGKVSS